MIRQEPLFTRDRGKAPGQFHFLVMEASGNALLVGLYAGVLATLRRAVDAGTVVHASDAESRRRDHEVLLAAIEAGDPVAAAHIMAEHIDRDLIPAD